MSDVQNRRRARIAFNNLMLEQGDLGGVLIVGSMGMSEAQMMQKPYAMILLGPEVPNVNGLAAAFMAVLQLVVAPDA